MTRGERVRERSPHSSRDDWRSHRTARSSGASLQAELFPHLQLAVEACRRTRCRRDQRGKLVAKHPHESHGFIVALVMRVDDDNRRSLEAEPIDCAKLSSACLATNLSCVPAGIANRPPSTTIPYLSISLQAFPALAKRGGVECRKDMGGWDGRGRPR